MTPSFKRARTPSLASCLLTPSSTGGSRKRVRFVDVDNTISSSSMSAQPSQERAQTTYIDQLDHVPITATASFPFMKLPRSVRNKVYHYLLVVPAIICTRQKHVPFHENIKALLYTERRQFLPGIAYALAQITVDGLKVHFSRFSTTNINILRVSSKLHDEAKKILYANNSFEIIKPILGLAPLPNDSAPLFPTGCQYLVTKLNIRIDNFYGLQWLLSDGCNAIQNDYRSLLSLTLILEKQSTTKGFGKKWARNKQEKWTAYVRRLHGHLSQDLFGAKGRKTTGVIPTWIDLRVLFTGESYDESDCVSSKLPTGDQAPEQRKRDEMRYALAESWELFKAGGK